MPVRQPTHNEAVDIMLLAKSTQQWIENLSYWRKKYGDAFANHVEADAKKRKGKK